MHALAVDQQGAAVPAVVGERAQHAVGAAHQEDRAADRLERAVVAGVRHHLLATREEPALQQDVLALQREHRRIGVEAGGHRPGPGERRGGGGEVGAIELHAAILANRRFSHRPGRAASRRSATRSSAATAGDSTVCRRVTIAKVSKNGSSNDTTPRPRGKRRRARDRRADDRVGEPARGDVDGRLEVLHLDRRLDRQARHLRPGGQLPPGRVAHAVRRERQHQRHGGDVLDGRRLLTRRRRALA